MGIHAVLSCLPGGNFQKERKHGFFDGSFEHERIVHDVAGLLHSCARKEQQHYVSGNYKPALKRFQGVMTCLQSVCRWKQFVVFDGLESELKECERKRRDASSAADDVPDERVHIRNDPQHIAMAAKTCKERNVPCVVAQKQADSQCRFVLCDELNATLLVTGDSDLLACGNRRVAVIASHWCDECRLVDATSHNLKVVIEKLSGTIQSEDDDDNSMTWFNRLVISNPVANETPPPLQLALHLAGGRV